MSKDSRVGDAPRASAERAHSTATISPVSFLNRLGIPAHRARSITAWYSFSCSRANAWISSRWRSPCTVHTAAASARRAVSRPRSAPARRPPQSTRTGSPRSREGEPKGREERIRGAVVSVAWRTREGCTYRCEMKWGNGLRRPSARLRSVSGPNGTAGTGIVGLLADADGPSILPVETQFRPPMIGLPILHQLQTQVLCLLTRPGPFPRDR